MEGCIHLTVGKTAAVDQATMISRYAGSLLPSDPASDNASCFYPINLIRRDVSGVVLLRTLHIFVCVCV